MKFDIADAEIRALRRLDIPLFTTVANSTSLFADDGQEIRDVFAHSAWDRVSTRAATIHDFPLSAEVAVMCAAIDAARGGREVSRPAATDTRPPARRGGARSAGVSDDEVLSALHDIARCLLDARAAPFGDGRGWLSLTWSPARDVRYVGPAAGDLCGGALGPALFLAEFAAVSGDDQSASVSASVLQELGELSTTGFGADYDARFAIDGWPIGGLTGPGALVYVAGRVARLPQTEWVSEFVERQVDRALAAVRDTTIGVEMSAGLAGWHLQLAGARANGRLGPSIDDALRWSRGRLADALLNTTGASDSPDVTRRLQEIMPAGRDGIALALHMTRTITPTNDDDRSALDTAVASHTFALSSHGGRLAAIAVGRSSVTMSASVHIDPRTLADMTTRHVIRACEESQLGDQVGRHSSSDSGSPSYVRAILDRRRTSGRWCDDRLVDDHLNLSAFDGVPAIGRILLRHVVPTLPVLGVFGWED